MKVQLTDLHFGVHHFTRVGRDLPGESSIRTGGSWWYRPSVCVSGTATADDSHDRLEQIPRPCGDADGVGQAHESTSHPVGVDTAKSTMCKMSDVCISLTMLQSMS